MEQLFFYLRDVRRFSGKRLWIAAALVACGALLEGLGIVALIPLFSLAIGAGDDPMGTRLIAAFEAIGLVSPSTRAAALVAAFLALIGIRAFILFQRDMFIRRLALAYVDSWRARIFAAVMAAPWTAIVSQRRTDIEHAITNDVSRLSVGNDRMLQAASQVAIILVQLAVLAALSLPMFGFVLGLLALTFVIGVPVMRKASALGGRLTGTGRHIHHVLGSFLAGQRLARVNNAQQMFAARMDDAVQDVRENQLSFARSQGLSRTMLQLLSAVAISLILMVGYFALEIGLAVLLVVVVMVARIATASQQVLQTAQSTANMLPALGALRSTIAALQEDAKSPTSLEPAAVEQPVKGALDLSLSNVWFAHQPGKWILNGVSLSIGAGECVALAGPSGVGKSTLLDIVTGLLPAAKGSVCVDGMVMEAPQHWHSLRERIAYLPQDPFLFDVSIAENLRWFAPHATVEDIDHALQLAGADQLIAHLPSGIDEIVGERGQTLSGGERQRICLARALLRKPGLLILDEALSALDEPSASGIMERLSRWQFRPTILFVTHREEGMRFADRIVHLA